MPCRAEQSSKEDDRSSLVALEELQGGEVWRRLQRGGSVKEGTKQGRQATGQEGVPSGTALGNCPVPRRRCSVFLIPTMEDSSSRSNFIPNLGLGQTSQDPESEMTGQGWCFR